MNISPSIGQSPSMAGLRVNAPKPMSITSRKPTKPYFPKPRLKSSPPSSLPRRSDRRKKMKKQVRFRAVFPIKEYVELAMPKEHFKALADSMVDKPFYDSPDIHNIDHIIGKVISAKWVPEKNCIEYEVETGT